MDRYILIDSVDTIKKRYNIETSFDYKENYNISPGIKVPVITSESPENISFFSFGLTPSWAKTKMNHFNVRIEGDSNRENNPNYSGKGIILKPTWGKLLRTKRCIIIASAYIQGTQKEGLNKPYLVYLQDKKRPFSMAGIYDIWTSPGGETIQSFAILTTVANEFIRKEIGYPRMPVIISQEYEKSWLREGEHLSKITRVLKPYQQEKMNAYPISPEIQNNLNNAKDFILPIGEPLKEELGYKPIPRTHRSGRNQMVNKNKE